MIRCEIVFPAVANAATLVNALAPRYPRVLSDDPDRRHPFQPSGQSDAWLAFADQIAQSRHAAQR